MIGFWFDGGLFKLPTAVVFGTLLALAAASRAYQTERTDVGCSGVAALAVLATVALTALHLGAPQLPVHERSVRLARQWLVPAHERDDLDFLIAHVDWAGSRLRTPLQHAHLAHYNCQLVNWRVEDTLLHERGECIHLEIEEDAVHGGAPVPLRVRSDDASRRAVDRLAQAHAFPTNCRNT